MGILRRRFRRAFSIKSSIFFNEIIACISMISLRGSAPHQLTREQGRLKRGLKSPQKPLNKQPSFKKICCHHTINYNLVNLDLILIRSY